MKSDYHFRARVQKALSDDALQVALDGNADRRQAAFTKAYTSLPKPLAEMRKSASAIRTETIDRLDEYLEQFISKAQANGLIVHRAEDGQQATEIVIDIARGVHAHSIAKSKSMVSEEIHINQALESEGIRVIETDLGEYIVQLRGEPPAHIITPSVHVNRSEVGEIFHKKLNIPFTDDIPTLTAAARRTLRQIFLEADIGISGVNFGVAETGALCIITNEGNGRMVTSLPDVHIALMGIERLVPTLDDLATLLYLLPRSATGQKITVYTDLIHSPRRNGEIDGPSQRHLILLDNGRQALRDTSLKEVLNCIRCGACLNVCPIFREIGGHSYVGAHNQYTPYPGPIGSVISPGLFTSAEFGHLARASSLCGACKDACPVDIDLPVMLLRIRAADDITPIIPADSSTTKPTTHIPISLKFGLRFYSWIASSSGRFAAAQRLAGIFSRLFIGGSNWMRLPDFTGWGYQRDFPRPAVQPFRKRFISTSLHDDPMTLRSTVLPLKQSSQPVEIPVKQTMEQDQSISKDKENKTSSIPDVLEHFRLELTAIGGEFTRCQEEELFDKLVAFLNKQNTTRLQAWEPAYLPYELLSNLKAHGIQVVHEPDDSIVVGLTGVLGGIAETGTLIIPGGPGRPLTASLLPEIHIAVLKSESIRPTWVEAMQINEIRTASSVVMVSGPSRTADIEMTLTIGVHGPRQVHVFCV